MSKRRRICPCGSGKEMRRCCGARSSQTKLDLERSARRFAELGMHGEASETLLERAKLSSHNPMVWNDLGVEYAAAGKPDEAHAAFVRAYKAFPDFPVPLYNLARLVMDRCFAEQAQRTASPFEVCKFAREAMGYLQESLSRDTYLAQAHALLSAAYEVVGSSDLARVHMPDALELKLDILPSQIRNVLQRTSRLTTFTRVEEMVFPFLSSSGESIYTRSHQRKWIPS